ncbi:DUF1651 domain-containing protein [Synechococcus sp. CS-1330]|nr:DUF1651 domain-containing protein [Synechococcus sp. CS-1330]
MNVTNSPGRPPLSPQEGWLSDGRQVLHFQPRRYDRWSQSLEVTFGEVMPSGEQPLLKRRRELMRNEAIKLWAKKRRSGWQVCAPQWTTPQPPRA